MELRKRQMLCGRDREKNSGAAEKLKAAIMVSGGEMMAEGGVGWLRRVECMRERKR